MIEDNYEDIINLKYTGTKTHTPMSMENRSAQFAPFAALTGYSDSIIETSRLTKRKIELNDEQKELINARLNLLNEEIKKLPIISITHFVKDKNKSGGEYITTVGNLRRIDFIESYIELKNKIRIFFDDILDIESDMIKWLNNNLY